VVLVLLVVGVVAVGEGVVLLTDYRGWGSVYQKWMVPKFSRKPRTANQRWLLGISYVVTGLVLVIVGLVLL
jgi:hypothetical protein